MVWLASTTPQRSRRHLWLLIPVVVGTASGVVVAIVPLARHLLAFALILSGLAWILRIASDWLAERAGPQRGVFLIAVVLFGTWLGLVTTAPRQLEGVGFGPLRAPTEPPDPYAIPPAGSRGPLRSLQNPQEEVDPIAPLKEILRPAPAPPDEPESPRRPTDGSRATPRVSLQVSSGVSRAGEGVVLVAELRGDGRTLRGYVEFLVGETVVDRRLVRVQGAASQAEFRLVGLKPGTHKIRARYRGSRSFNEAESPIVQHRVAEK